MPFGSGARPLASTQLLPAPGLIVAQVAPLHHYYQLANEINAQKQQWEMAQAAVTPQIAGDLAAMAKRYPDLPASILTGAAVGGIPADHPALTSLNERMGYARTLDPIRTASSTILDVPFDFVRGGVRIATTIFASLYEEVVPRHTRQFVGMSQGMSASEARELSGDSVGLRALDTFFNDPWGNLTWAESSPEGQVNLGSGWLPHSNLAESDTAEVQMLMGMGIPEPNAIAQVQQQYGDPLSQIAYEQAHTGITFADGQSISPGRLAARSIGLEPGTMPFHIVSGAADFSSQLVLDPTNLALWGLGKARIWNKMLIGGGSRRGIWGVHVDDYLNSPDYRHMNSTYAKMRDMEDIADTLPAISGKSPEGFSIRKLSADLSDAPDAAAADKAIRPYFGGSGTDGIPMFERVPTPRSIMNPSGSRRTMGQILGGRFAGESGLVGETFGLKAAVHHNMEGTWSGRMFSQMGGTYIETDDLDRGFQQFRLWLNSADMKPAESHHLLYEFARLVDGDGPGAVAVVKKAKAQFVDTKIPGASDEVKEYILRTWNRLDSERAFWVNERGQSQWSPDVEIIGRVDDDTIVISKDTAQMVDELFNNTIPLPDPRHIRRALSDEGLAKIARLTSYEKSIKVGGIESQAELVERAWLNVLDGYMQKVWKPLVLMRVAWPVRVVFEEQLRMAASGLDSMFSHPISWFSYAFGGKMNKTLLGDSMEVIARKKGKLLLDFNPEGTFDEFTTALAKGKGPMFDSAGKSLGQVNYINVFRDSPHFADAWLWNLSKNHADPVMAYLRSAGIDDTVEWLMKGQGKKYLKQITETANPVRKAFLGGTVDEVTAPRLRWYVEGLHARTTKLLGGDYVYWNPHVKSVIIDNYTGGWLSSGDTPLLRHQLTEHGLDAHGPPDPGPIPKRPKPDGGSGPSPVDGIPEGGKPPNLGAGGGSAAHQFTLDDIVRLQAERKKLLDEMLTLHAPDEIERLARRAKEMERQITTMQSSLQRTAAETGVPINMARASLPNLKAEVPIQPRIKEYDRPFSANDPVRVQAASGKAKDKSFNTMGYHINTGGYDANRGFSAYYNSLSSGAAYRRGGADSIDLLGGAPSGVFDSEMAAVDDIARLFMGPDGVVDDVALTKALNEWFTYAKLDDVQARFMSEDLVFAINVRHQQQLDLLNYVYPGRLSQRGAVLDELTKPGMYGGIKLIADNLTPDQMGELRFIHRFMDTLMSNETGWGRDASMTVDHVLDNFGNEFVKITQEHPLVRRLIAMGDEQRVHNKPISLHSVQPDELGKAAKKGDKPHIISGYVAEGELDNLGLYTNPPKGTVAGVMGETLSGGGTPDLGRLAAISIDDYTTVDIPTLLDYAVTAMGEPRLMELIEDMATTARSTAELNHDVVQSLIHFVQKHRGGSFPGGREFLIEHPGSNGAYILQGAIDPNSPILKGVSQELTSFFNDLQGAWFAKPVATTKPTGVVERRVIMGGYDGMWSATDRANFVGAVTEGGAFTDQGSESIAKVVEVLQSRDGGLTREWLDALGREIASSNSIARPDRPLPIGSLHQLETATTVDLADELVRLSAGFRSKEVAADDLIRAIKPGASVDAHTGIEARLVEIVEEINRRGDAAFSRTGTDDDLFDVMTDAIHRYAQLDEADPDDIWDIVNWVDSLTSQLDMQWGPTRSYWPRHMMDEFSPASQPHLYGDIEGWKALPDDAEIWVFHGTDPLTARRMLVDGIDPRDKPFDKTRGPTQYKPTGGLDTGTYVSGSPIDVGGYTRWATVKKTGTQDSSTIVAIKVRKGDLKVPTEAADYLDAPYRVKATPYGEGEYLTEAFFEGGLGVTFDIPVPAGNIKMMSLDVPKRGIPLSEEQLADELMGRAAHVRDVRHVVQQNIDAGANLSDDAAVAIRLAEKAGYRVEVVSSKARFHDIWIMDRDRIIRIQERDLGDESMKWLTMDEKGGVAKLLDPNYRTPTGREAPDQIMFVREYSPDGKGYTVLDDPDVHTVSDAVVKVLGDGKGIPIANAPRPGFRYMLEMPYGRPRFKPQSGPKYGDGSPIDFDNLSIMGTAKARLKETLPDAPKPPEPPPPPPSQPFALGPGKGTPALGTGEPTPPGGFAGQGGMNDPNFQGTYYKITESPNAELLKAHAENSLDDMELYAGHSPATYADDMEGLSARHAALRDRIDSAPETLTIPDPTYNANQQGLWDKAIETVFYYLMSAPTNKLSRAPAFKQYYLERVLHLRSFADDATRNQIDNAVRNDLGVDSLEKFRRDPTPPEFLSRGEAGAGVSLTFDQIDTIAKGYALEHTRNLLYDLSKKHDASDILRNIFPFAEAWGEIITRWSKIMWENPRMFRRAQQGIESAREQGWFYQDANGQEVFAYPGSGFITKAMLGLGGDSTEVQLTGTTAGVNLALGQYIPGFGPAVQVPTSMLLPNMPTFDGVRDFLMPYGDEEIRTPGDILNLALPAWIDKMLIAIGTSDANYKRLHYNTVMDVYRILAAENPEKMNSTASSYALMEEASRKASWVSWLRAGAAFFSPTSPQIEYSVEDSEGTMWQLQAMIAEYYRLLRTHDFDQQLALEDYVRRFGFGENMLSGIGVASTFITAKSIEVQERSTTEDGFAWQRNNMDLFEPDKYPYTAAYAMQDLEWDEFDYRAYLDTLKQGTRESLSPDEWLMRRNKLVGNLAYDHAKGLVLGRTDQAASLWKRDMRIKLATEYPGFDADIAGLPQRPDTDTMIMEIERWVSEPRLDGSRAGQAAQVYMALRRRAEAEAYNRGLMPDSWRTAKSMVEWRNWLRESSTAIMQVFPEFGQLWFDVFRWELTEDETPETLELGGMTF